MIEIRGLALDTADGRGLVEGLDLSVPEGGTLLLAGPSGCGKSRLLNVIAGVEPPARGRVMVGGHDLWPGSGALGLAGRVRLGMAFASGGLLSNLSLWDNIALPLRFQGNGGAELSSKVEAALDRLELRPLAALRPHAVSASARKRANLARVWALEPGLALLDDPLAGLGEPEAAWVLELVRAWAGDPSCTLVIAAEGLRAFSGLAGQCLQLPLEAKPLERP